MGGWIVQISVAVIALAVVVLVYYLVQTLKSARTSMEQVNSTLAAVQRQLEETVNETNRLLRNTQQITEDVQHKLAATDKIFSSVQQVGDAVHELSHSVKQVSASVSKSMIEAGEAVHRNKGTLQNAAEWATLGYQLIQSIRSRSQRNTDTR